MTSRLPDGNERNLQQFVNQSTWEPVPVQRRINERLLPLVHPPAWVIDDVSVAQAGQMSVAAAPRYCGALGKRANCQVAVSIHTASDTASCPPQWRRFLACGLGLEQRPPGQDHHPARGHASGEVAPGIGHLQQPVVELLRLRASSASFSRARRRASTC